jgi:hypothetical protein
MRPTASWRQIGLVVLAWAIFLLVILLVSVIVS